MRTLRTPVERGHRFIRRSRLHLPKIGASMRAFGTVRVGLVHIFPRLRTSQDVVHFLSGDELLGRQLLSDMVDVGTRATSKGGVRLAPNLHDQEIRTGGTKLSGHGTCRTLCR